MRTKMSAKVIPISILPASPYSYHYLCEAGRPVIAVVELDNITRKVAKAVKRPYHGYTWLCLDHAKKLLPKEILEDILEDLAFDLL